jgi:putative ABC transport system substrate-binding protein
VFTNKPAVNMAQRSGAAALNVLASPLLFGNRQLIMDRVAALRLPAIYQFPETAAEGGFCRLSTERYRGRR